jgi:hypothetical protein
MLIRHGNATSDMQMLKAEPSFLSHIVLDEMSHDILDANNTGAILISS